MALGPKHRAPFLLSFLFFPFLLFSLRDIDKRLGFETYGAESGIRYKMWSYLGIRETGPLKCREVFLSAKKK